MRIARQARSEKKEKLFQIFRQRKGEVLIACKARWDVQLNFLVELESRCQSFRADVEYLCERQDVVTDLVVSKKDMQRTAPEDCQRKNYEELKELEEQRTKEALVLLQKKHKLIKWEGERERTRTMQILEVTRTMSPWSGGHDCSSFGSCSSSLAPKADEAMSASSTMAQEMDEAILEASWTALAKENGRDWWSIDLEGEVEELEVGCPWTISKSDSMDSEGEMNHQSDGKKAAIEEKDNLVKLKDDEMEVDMEVDAGVPQAESAEI